MAPLPMRQHIGDSPVVVVHNYLESFRPFLSRTGDENILLDRRFNGDQALFWLGDNKLVVTSTPIANLETLAARWGYTGTKNISPQHMTASLSEDILREKALLTAVLACAADDGRITLIPYASTPEFLHLAEILQTKYGLEVRLPESPTQDHLWVKNYLDSKVGFRTIFSQWTQGSPDHKYPQGFICDNLADVSKMVQWFQEKGKGCVIKASQGGSGVGNLFLTREEIPDSLAAIQEHLQNNIYLSEDLYIVEELIDSPAKESPSAEYYCPPDGTAPPRLTYISNQHFEASGRFAGVMMAKEISAKPWYPNFLETAQLIADNMQQMGYVGYFDVDSIVDGNNDIYMVEINTRRTGGTYAHEFMEFVFGPDYEENYAVLAQNKMSAGCCRTLQELEQTLSDLLYPISGEQKGVILLLTSTLPAKGTFGFVILGETLQETKNLLAAMTAKLSAKKII